MTQAHESLSTLKSAIEDEDYSQVLKTANQLLSLSELPDQAKEDALKCKVVGLLHLGKFDEALSATEKHAKLFQFERGYSLYRLKKWDHLKELLSDAPSEERFSELKAQTFFSQEDYVSAQREYEELVKEYGPSSDAITNLSAAYVKTQNYAGLSRLAENHKDILDETFEFVYNYGTLCLQRGEITKGEKYLKDALKICERELTKEGLTEKEIGDEKAIILTQLAYIEHVKGNKDKAKNMYESVDASKPSDPTVHAVCANNIVSLRGGSDTFDSLRKFKHLQSDAVKAKLPLNQQEVIGFNYCLLLLLSKRVDECRSQLQKLQKEYPNNDLYSLLLATLLYKEKKITKAQALLGGILKENPDNIKAGLVIAQMHLDQNNIPEAIKVLMNIKKLRSAPAMVCTLVTLHENIKNLAGAIQVLDVAVANMDESEPHYKKILRMNAEFKLSCGRPQDAAKAFKKLLSLDKSNVEILMMLLIAYAQFDPEKARELEDRVPELEGVSDVDAAQLENKNLPDFNPQRVAPKQLEDAKNQKQKPKKKKKRHNKPPKEIVPGSKPDPERWLPMYERSYYKGRRRQTNRGAQGAIAASYAVQQREKKENRKNKKKNKQQNQNNTEQNKQQNQKREPSPVAGRGRAAKRGRGKKRGRGRGKRR